MEETTTTTTNDVTTTIIDTINTIFENLFSSIDNNLYSVLDDITFITSKILNDNYFEKIFGTSTSSGILLIANSLLIGLLLYFGAKYLLSNFTYVRNRNPSSIFYKNNIMWNLYELFIFYSWRNN